MLANRSWIKKLNSKDRGATFSTFLGLQADHHWIHAHESGDPETKILFAKKAVKQHELKAVGP